MGYTKKGVVAACFVLALFLASGAAQALTWVDAEGFVHSKSFAIFIIYGPNGEIIGSQGYVTLKIQRADGTKVNADCRYVSATCDALQVNDLAAGRARCEDGWCSWTELTEE